MLHPLFLLPSLLLLPLHFLPLTSAQAEHGGWVAQYGNDNCTGTFPSAPGTNTEASLNHALGTGSNQVGSCVTFAPTLDTIGIFWGSKQQGLTGTDKSFTQLLVYTDADCKNTAGWVINRPSSWAQEGPMACWSMKAFGGPYGSVQIGKFVQSP